MPLLYDRIDRTRAMRRNINNLDDDARVFARRFMADMPVFEVTNVAQMENRLDGMEYDPGDGTPHGTTVHVNPEAYPNFAPPFANYWMEFRVPDKAEIWVEKLGRIGVWCTESTAIDDPDGQALNMTVWVDEHKPWQVGYWHLRHDGRGNILGDPGRMQMVTGNHEYVVDRMIGRAIGISPDRDGALAIIREADEEMHRIAAEQGREAAEAYVETRRAELVAIRDEANADLQRIIEEQVANIAHYFHYMALPVVLQAHALLGCKNVTTESQRPPERLSKAHRKRRGHGLVVFKTLVVTPRGGRRDDERRVSIGDGMTAMHIVRGHLKTYTAEAPLLGRHVGTYYWAGHARGNPAAGVVVKDYEVRP